MTELRRPLGGSLARTLNLIERVLEVEEGVVVRRIPDDGVLERRDAVVEERLTLAEVLRPEAEAENSQQVVDLRSHTRIAVRVRDVRQLDLRGDAM